MVYQHCSVCSVFLKKEREEMKIKLLILILIGGVGDTLMGCDTTTKSYSLPCSFESSFESTPSTTVPCLGGL